MSLARREFLQLLALASAAGLSIDAPWVLAVSWWQAANSERTVQLAESFPAEDLKDFEAIGQHKPRTAMTLPGGTICVPSNSSRMT